MTTAKNREPFNPDFDYADDFTTAEAVEILDKFYNDKLKPFGDHAPRQTIAGTVEILHKEITAIFWLVTHLQELQRGRSKGGKANKKFASNKERYDFHNAKRRKKPLE